MRLIDADNLQFNGRNYNKSQMNAILDFVDAQPTTYDPDKVVEQLEEVLSLADKVHCNSIQLKDMQQVYLMHLKL